MAKRKLDESQLMAATEELLLEKGYEAFHFKLLSEKLNVGRSTLYEYYGNKDELITSYMNNVMGKIFCECEQISKDIAPVEQLKRLLQVFLKYSQIHQIIQIIPLLKESDSISVQKRLDQLDEEHKQILQMIKDMIRDAREEGEIRGDIPDVVIAGIIFNAIQIPNVMNIKPADWSEMIFDIIYRGIEHKNT